MFSDDLSELLSAYLDGPAPDLITGELAPVPVTLAPYQVRWLTLDG